MKREVLFKGKRIDNEEFVEGDLIELGDQVWIADKTIWVTEFCKGTIELECAEVDPETVSQFLFEANGHKFFQDCIIKKNKSDQLWVIVWNEEINNFSCLTSYEYLMLFDEDQKPFILSNHTPVNYVWIVKNGFYPVGNIHDNPELVSEAT